MDTTTWVLIVAVPIMLIIGVVLVLRKRKPREEAVLHFRCPNCKRRLRYFARQAGHKGRCNSCKESLIFPSHLASSR
jgi:hypothetical protein